MSIEKRAAPYQGPSDLNKGYSVASRPGGLSYAADTPDRDAEIAVASRPGGLSYRDARGGQAPALR